MPIKTITFVKVGSEPKPARNTQSEAMLQEVLAKAKQLPAGHSMVIALDEAKSKKFEPYALTKKIKANLAKGYVAYRTGFSIVVTKEGK
jgi:hypothetical protein